MKNKALLGNYQIVCPYSSVTFCIQFYLRKTKSGLERASGAWKTVDHLWYWQIKIRKRRGGNRRCRHRGCGQWCCGLRRLCPRSGCWRHPFRCSDVAQLVSWSACAAKVRRSRCGCRGTFIISHPWVRAAGVVLSNVGSHLLGLLGICGII